MAVPQVSSAVAKRYRLLEPICGTAATCVERPKPIDPEPCPTIKEPRRAVDAVHKLLLENVIAQGRHTSHVKGREASVGCTMQ